MPSTRACPRLVGYDAETGRIDLAALEAAVTQETAAVLVQSPNFFGVIEDIPAIAAIAHAKGALLIVSIAEAVSLGVVRPPVEADIVSMEAQSFGVALSYGGPFCGVIATKEQYVRQMPGRLVGQTVDGSGYRGFVLTLSTREQHIRREKATSNICTNQALVALMATIFLTSTAKKASASWPSTTWPKRITRRRRSRRNPAQSCSLPARRASTSLFCKPKSSGAMEPAADGRKDCRRHRAEPLVSRTGQRTLWCATEVVTREQIDTAAKVLAAGRWRHNDDRRNRPAAHHRQSPPPPDAERGSALREILARQARLQAAPARRARR
jgi:glycine dehydrogenase subunit 1